MIAEPSIWVNIWVGAGVLTVTAVVLTAWSLVELRTTAPLVDLRLMRMPTVLRANTAMLIAGVGMYLLFSLLIRYVQTPAATDYGFALPGIAAGAALIPFSILGFIAGKTVPRLVTRITGEWAYVASVAAVMAAAALFAIRTDNLIVVLVSMSVLGFGVGGVSSVMPKLVLTGVPVIETASVLTINQIVRSIGFSIGSALTGFLLAAATPAGSNLPTQSGFITAALWAIAPLALSGLLLFLRRPSIAENPTNGR